MGTNNNEVFNLLYSIKGVEGKYSHKAPSPSTYMLSVKLPPRPTSVSEITITAPSSTVAPGNTIALTANVLPEDAEDKSVTWSSSNDDYATVDENGVVTAKEAGAGKSVVITAEANDGSGVSGSYTLNIDSINIPVTGVVLSSPSKNIKVGSQVQLSATIQPSNATNKSISWSSSKRKLRNSRPKWSCNC